MKNSNFKILKYMTPVGSWDSVVSIATGYGLDSGGDRVQVLVG
jgi:hypothetical protein